MQKTALIFNTRPRLCLASFFFYQGKCCLHDLKKKPYLIKSINAFSHITRENGSVSLIVLDTTSLKLILRSSLIDLAFSRSLSYISKVFIQSIGINKQFKLM